MDMKIVRMVLTKLTIARLENVLILGSSVIQPDNAYQRNGSAMARTIVETLPLLTNIPTTVAMQQFANLMSFNVTIFSVFSNDFTVMQMMTVGMEVMSHRHVQWQSAPRISISARIRDASPKSGCVMESMTAETIVMKTSASKTKQSPTALRKSSSVKTKNAFLLVYFVMETMTAVIFLMKNIATSMSVRPDLLALKNVKINQLGTSVLVILVSDPIFY